jgi:hypothetical protein
MAPKLLLPAAVAVELVMDVIVKEAQELIQTILWETLPLH